MGQRSMSVADVKEILVWWDSGESVSAIARRLGYTRPTVRKYTRAAERVGLRRGAGRRGEEEWERLARAALQRVTRRSGGGKATAAGGGLHCPFVAWGGGGAVGVL